MCEWRKYRYAPRLFAPGRFTQGYKASSSVPPLPQELRATFTPLNATMTAASVDADSRTARRWSDLTHALSGIFGASLHQMAAQGATTLWGGIATPEQQMDPAFFCPSASSRPSSHSSPSSARSLLAWLPKEPVCTENLTPWLKLLPCRDEAGLAQLLGSRGSIFSASE